MCITAALTALLEGRTQVLLGVREFRKRFLNFVLISASVTGTSDALGLGFHGLVQARLEVEIVPLWATQTSCLKFAMVWLKCRESSRGRFE